MKAKGGHLREYQQDRGDQKDRVMVRGNLSKYIICMYKK
jgi:hypothetical protein